MSTRIKLSNFNLCNLVLPNHKYYKRLEYSPTDYERKIEWIGGQLRKMNADIVGLQEVFHKQALEDAVKKSGIYRSENIIVLGENGEMPVNGLISRFPITKSEVIFDIPEKAQISFDSEPSQVKHFHHPLLKAIVELPGNISVTVFVVHLKSMRPIIIGQDWDNEYDEREFALGKARSLLIRAAEATALRYLLCDVMQHSNMPVIVIGDLNDSVDSVTSKIITGEPPEKRFPSKRKREIWDQVLYSTYAIQARHSYRDVYYTHIHNGIYESLDHILVSQEFIAANPHSIGRVEYMRVFNDHLIDRTLSNENPPYWQSDHGQVLVSIELYDRKMK